MSLANKITIVRILLIPFFITCFIYYSPEWDFLRFIALAIFAISALTDAIDGYVARRYYQKTKLGTVLDPLADKLLIISAFICLSMVAALPQELRIPPWVSVVVISRDILIVLGFFIMHMLIGEIEIKPSMLGKITAAFQMITIIVVLLQLRYSYVIWTAAAAFTTLSGIGYLIRANRILNEPRTFAEESRINRKKVRDESR
ncbi:MAG: CDP-diacylglycerol--glycerol-3-phosphate 3-phosphatidyltransferase [Candidatus Omnitrophota bacterium]|nr:MAG: CDP-diacylglycerol--glycerol-3-phosphate 3-phosphatidyltransferase [Candidatus Omnitrophota bacterium]